MKKVIYYLIFLAVLVIGSFGYYVWENQDLQKDNDKREKNSEMFVYETDAESADECSSYEKFDTETKVCSFECADELECKEIQTKIDDELATWTDELAKDTEPVQEKNIAENDKSLVAEYRVTTGEEITLESGSDNAEFQNIWGEIKDLSPDSLSDKYIELYQVFDNKDDDTLAFVDDEDQNGKWRVAVNLAGYKTSTEKENKATFIHELGHIVSLNSSQVENGVEKENCSNFYLDEGCTKTNSYLNNFQKTFWKNEKKDKNGGAIFDENKFVTEYASSNEVEDLAESFAFFVLGKDKDSLGNSIKEEKLKIFYSYPEIVVIRNDMRSVLKQDIVRAKKRLEK